jgi:TolB-like protein/DNA-binding winged helix-turn-helix (wHTH) protein/Tfp pilus assembly protein PilF
MTAPALPAPRILRFDVFELNLQAGELRKRGVRLRLQGQPVQVLAMLLASAGQLVTRDELRTALWAADTFVDFDHSLHNAVARLREALSDSAESPRFIETLPRRGYRFIAPVEVVHASPILNGPAAPPRIPSTPGLANTEASPVRTRRGVALALSSCAIALVGFGAWHYVQAKAAGLAIRSIAVLPFQDMSGDATQEFFADGMTEELITEMSRIPSLKVISRTSAMAYKGTRKRLPQIARELGANAIVEGSVAREGDQVRVTVQLLDGPDDRHLWSEEYERPIKGILNLQRDIAQAIALRVSAHVTAEQQARLRSVHAIDPEAYDLYLRGRYFLYNTLSTPQPLNAAKSYFEASIQKDPGFAPAYAALANLYINLAFYRRTAPGPAVTAAKNAVAKALALDDSLSEAHYDLALLKWRYEWDWTGAEREFNRAFVLDPHASYDVVHYDYADYLAWRGRRDDAVSELRKGRELNPGSSQAGTDTAVYFQLRDYTRLIEAGRKSVAAEPTEWLDHFFLGTGYEAVGQRAEAIPEFETAVKLAAGDQDVSAALAYAYAAVGRRGEAEKMLRDLMEESQRTYVSPYMIGMIYAGLGDKEKAFEFLDKAYQERCVDLVWQLKSDPRLDSLRSDPRFEAFWRRVGFPM